MKNLFITLLLGVLLLPSCKEDDNVRLDSRSKLWIYGVDSPRHNKLMHEYNAKVRKVHDILANDSIMLRFSDTSISCITISFHEGNIDTINDRFSLMAGNITHYEDNVFLNDTAMCIVDYRGDIMNDTIGYIPAEQVNAMREKIIELWETEDWKKIYKTFEDGLQFIPCTAEDYKRIHGLQ